MQEDLLYTHRFLPDDSIPQPNQKQLRESFRKFYETKFGKPLLRDAGTVNYPSESLLSTQPVSNVGTLTLQAQRPATGQQIQAQDKAAGADAGASSGSGEDPPVLHGMSLRTAIIAIDSGDRDKTLYPNQNNFRIYFGENFINVKRVSLVSTEFPNTEQLIKSQPASKKNNKLYWTNGPDEPDTGIIYSITITEGNYTALTLANELMAKTNVVQRLTDDSSDVKKYHNFAITVDNVTNTFTIRQQNSFNLNNPLNVTQGSSVVTVSHDLHNFLPGQIVNLSGSTKIGGIPTDAINASQVISVDIEKVDKMVRVSTASLKQTQITYGISSTPLTGVVNTNKGSRTVIGLGTNFLAQLGPGSVTHIGYANYTVACVVSNFEFTTEEALQESFNKFRLIKNLTGASGLQPAGLNSTQSTNVFVLNNRLRNIFLDSSDANQVKADNNQETSTNDLALNIYKKIQKTISIQNLTGSFKIQVLFGSRDPTYHLFSQFQVTENIDSFNIHDITDSNKTLVTIDANNISASVVLPTGTFNIFSVLSSLLIALPSWQIAFDTVNHYFYFKPPLTGTSTTLTLPFGTAVYQTYSYISFDFTGSNTAYAYLGFAPGYTYTGTAILAGSAVNSTSTSSITLDSQYNAMYVMYNNNVITVTLSQRTYNNVSELANAIQSYLLSHNVSVSILVNTGLSSTSNTGQIVMIPVNRMSIAFKQGTPTTGVTLASALGFDSHCLHTSNCIVSVIKVGPALSASTAQGQGQQGYLQEGYYSHHLSEVVNAVSISVSKKLKGSALITNGSAFVQGAYDVLYFPLIGTTLTFGSNTTSIAGEVSGNVYINRSAPYGGLPSSSANLYITRTGNETNYSLAGMAYSQGIIKYLKVGLHPGTGTGFDFTDRSGHVTRIPQLQLGVTYVFDLTSLPLSTRFRLGQVCNGPYNANSAAQNLLDYNVNATGSLTEFYAYRSYYCEGKFLQVNIPSSAVNLNALYCYDDLDESRITCPSPSSLTARGDLIGQTYYFTMSPAGSVSNYINVSQSYNFGASTLTAPPIYTETPVLTMLVGQQYILDYTNISGQLQLSLTADGNHYIGSPISNAQYISYTVPGTVNGVVGTTSSININLSTAHMPFPPRLYYFLAGQAGCGGNGYIDIIQDPNTGVLEIVNPSHNYFRPFLFGSIVATLSGDSQLAASGTVLAYAPNHGLTAFTQNSQLQIADKNTAVSSAVALQAGYNITPDNNRFVIQDITGSAEYDIVLNVGIQTFYDLQADVEQKINDALGLSSLSNDQHWTVAFDNINSFYTFLIPNGRMYQFRFTDVATDGTELWNSSAELFGFRQADAAPNNFAALDHIRSNYPAIITRITDNTISVPAPQLNSFSQNAALVYTERVFDQSRIQVGTLTANVAQGDSSLQLSALPSSVVIGALLTLSDGNNSSEMGLITTIDPNSYTIGCANASRTGFAAATPTQVQLRSSFVLPGDYAEAYSGSHWQKDLAVGDQILLGEDFDQVFTVQSILSDSSIQLDSSANFVLPTTDNFGNVIAAPSTIYNLPIYKVTGMSVDQFDNNEKFEFFKSEQDLSIWDYDQKLVDTNIIVQRISPIKLAISETDAILEASLADSSGVYEFLSQKNFDLFYIKNNSKYHFPTKYEATSTVTARGGNPVNVGTGVKFSLLFSNNDTPGDLLGFPYVATSHGNTDFKTVLSNTIPRSDQQYDILRSEPGTGNKAGNLRVITTTLTAFEYGDQVFIEGHKNSSNTVAVNNDEGYTISIYSDDLSFTETQNGILQTRGVFYIPLDLSYGGSDGIVYKKTLFRPFALSGDNYTFMLCPTLASVNTTSTRMQQVFAKLILDAPPGAVLFNRFVSSDKIFTDALLPEFDHIDLTIVDPRGQFYEFNNVDYSLSLKISYYVDAPNNTNISARTGKPSS